MLPAGPVSRIFLSLSTWSSCGRRFRSAGRDPVSLDVGRIIAAQLLGAEAVLLGRIGVRAVRARTIPGVPGFHRRQGLRRQRQAQEIVDSLDRAEWVANELGMMDVEEPILADTFARRHGPFHADAQVIG